MEVKHRLNEKVSNIFAEVRGDASFLDFAGYDGIATTAEKTAADRGAAARGTYGAKRDRCKKGKSCGAACIFYRKDCILALEPMVSQSVSSIRNYLVGEMRKGNISEREAQRKFLQKTGLEKIRRKERGEDVGISRAQLGVPRKEATFEKDKKTGRNKLSMESERKIDMGVRGEVKKATSGLKEDRERMREGLSKLKEEVPNRAERSKIIKETATEIFDKTYGKQAAPRTSMEEINAMASPASQKRIEGMQGVMSKLEGGKLTAEQYNNEMAEAKSLGISRTKVTDGQLLVAESLLSPAAKNYLLNAGKVTTPSVYESDFPSSRAIPKGENIAKTVDEKRRWMRSNLRELMETKFADVYTGLPLNALKADLEHNVPEVIGKQFGVANVGGNKSFTSSQINQFKSNSPIDFLSIKNPNGFFKGLEFDANGKVTTESYNAKYASKMGKETLQNQIQQKSIPVATILSKIAAIPASDLTAKDRSSLVAHVVRTWTNAPGGVTIGPTGRGQVSFRWYGNKDQGWEASKAKNVGNKMAETIAKWEGQGDAGSKKIIELAGRLNGIQQRLLAINDMSFNGTSVRQQNITGDVRNFVNTQFKNILGEEEKGLLAFLE